MHSFTLKRTQTPWTVLTLVAAIDVRGSQDTTTHTKLPNSSWGSKNKLVVHTNYSYTTLLACTHPSILLVRVYSRHERNACRNLVLLPVSPLSAPQLLGEQKVLLAAVHKSSRLSSCCIAHKSAKQAFISLVLFLTFISTQANSA